MSRRLVGRRREAIAANIAQAKQECDTGKVFRGTVDEVIANLRQIDVTAA